MKIIREKYGDVREYVGEREALVNAAEHGLKLTMLLIKNGTASMIILSHACIVRLICYFSTQTTYKQYKQHQHSSLVCTFEISCAWQNMCYGQISFFDDTDDLNPQDLSVKKLICGTK